MRQNLKFMAMMLMGILLGVNSLWAEVDPVYTLTFPKNTSNSNYGNTYSFECVDGLSTIEWDVIGNMSSGSYLLVGGKNISKVARTITSKGYIQSSVAKVSIDHGAKGSSLTIGFIKVEGSTNSSFTSAKTAQISNPSVSSAGVLDFQLPDGEKWDMMSYYRITISCSNSTGDNANIKINSIKFYPDEIPDEPVTVTFNAGTNGTCSTASLTEVNAGDGVTLPSCTANEGYRFVGWSTSSTPTSANAGTATQTYRSLEDITLYAYYVPVYTATFYVNGAVYGDVNKYANGEAIVFPGEKPEDINGLKFVGWAEATIAGTTDVRPAMVAAKNMSSAAAIFYAVFAEASGSTSPYSFTINYSDLSTVSYADNDKSHNVTATCTTDGSKTMTVSYTTSNVMQSSSNLQFRKDPIGYLYNTTNLGSITSVTITGNVSLTTYYGSSAQPSTNDAVGLADGYFQIVGSSSATGKASSITVNFEAGDVSYSGYRTTIGEPVHVTWIVNGEEYTAGDPTTEVISGAKVTVLPTAPADKTLDCAEEFMGWSATPLGSRKGQGAPADLFETVEDSPVITEDVTFYAIFAKVRK